MLCGFQETQLQRNIVMKRPMVAGMTVVGLMIAGTLVMWSLRADSALAHCQVPCGIYDDAARIARLHEDADTIAKAMVKINEMAGAHEALQLNQATRWVATKEHHASHIIEVISEYFLAQRVKPKAVGIEGHDQYLKMLVEHHAVMIAAMKTKQSVVPAEAKKLHRAIDAIGAYYKK